MAEDLRIQFGDGVSALDRTMRGITMMVDGAIQEVVGLGYDRDDDGINVTTPDDGTSVLYPDEIGALPTWGVSFRGTTAFEISIEPAPLTVVGRWIARPPKNTWYRRFTRWWTHG